MFVSETAAKVREVGVCLCQKLLLLEAAWVKEERRSMSRVMLGIRVPLGGPECSDRGGRVFVSETAAVGGGLGRGRAEERIACDARDGGADGRA